MMIFIWIFAISISFSLGYVCAFFMWAPRIEIDRDEVVRHVAEGLIERIPVDRKQDETQSLHSEQG